MNQNVKLYECIILNSVFKNVYPMDIEHLSNINIFFKIFIKY
jgi:hypothetical protein